METAIKIAPYRRKLRTVVQLLAVLRENNDVFLAGNAPH
jgi:hypothetical protein